jgi:hypothetical protein
LLNAQFRDVLQGAFGYELCRQCLSLGIGDTAERAEELGEVAQTIFQ